MKTKLVLLLVFILAITACNDTSSYSDLLKQERKLIESFIANHGITVVDEEPSTWENNVYWRIPDYDNFYFQLVERGDTIQEFEAQDIVNLRYLKYTLAAEGQADTIRNWTTQDSQHAVEVQYMVQTDQSCTGWQVAIKYMKYNKAQCRIICPSKLGFSEENNNVTPYGYDIKITNP